MNQISEFQTEKNWALVYIILIHWIKSAFTSYGNQKEKIWRN